MLLFTQTISKSALSSNANTKNGLLEIAVGEEFHQIVKHISGKDNDAADALSRFDEMEWNGGKHQNL